MRKERPSIGRRILSAFEKGFKFLLFSFLSIFIHSRKVTSIDSSRIKKILIVRQHNQLGDMLCAVPLFRALRQTFPDAYIALVARPLNSEILQGSPFLNDVFVYHKQKFWTSPFAILKFLHGIRKKKFDLEITPTTVAMSVSSDVLAFLSKVKIRIGPNSLNGKRNVTRYMYNVRVDLDWRNDQLAHQTQRNLDVARIMNLKNVSHEIEIGLTEQEIETGRSIVAAHVKKDQLVIGFHPGAAKIQNRWDALRFSELANRCAEILGAFIIISAGPNDDEPVQEMLFNMPNEHLVVQPLRTVASVIRHCQVFITNDTGIMHVAAGVGTPVLSLFGPTDPLQWAPNGSQHRFILAKNCTMDGISVEKVWGVMNEMLRERAE